MKGLGKYKIGLLVIGLFVVVIFIFVLIQASNYRQDKETSETADKVAQSLNSYISTNNEIPENLSDATSESSDQIKYTNNGDGTYTVCVTYNSDFGYGDNLGSTSISSVLYRGTTAYSSSNYYYSSSDRNPSTLYFYAGDKQKGENCITVEPYIYESNSRSGSGSYDFNYVCETDYEYYEYYKDYCVDGVYQY